MPIHLAGGIRFQFVILLALLAVAPAGASVPDVLNFSGRLASEGSAFTGEVSAVVTFYDHETAGTQLWTQSYTLFVDQGRFHVLLGAVEGNPLPAEAIAEAEETWLGLTVGGEDEMAPRVRLASVPFAVYAGDSERVGGLEASDFAVVGHTHGIDQGQVEDWATAVCFDSAAEVADAGFLAAGESDVKSWAQEVCYDTPAELDGLGYVRVSGCGSGQIAQYIGSGWTCVEMPSGGTGGGSGWGLTGNAGTSFSNFIGTTDDQAIMLKVNNAVIASYHPASVDSGDATHFAGNVVLGYAGNVWYDDGGCPLCEPPASVGRTIAGGGALGDQNEVTSDFGTISGGLGNYVTGYAGSVAGGKDNQANASYATVTGGQENVCGGEHAAIGGGSANKASGQYATVPGGVANEATGLAGFAAGFAARSSHAGSFVWSDVSDPFTPFESSGDNQFLVRAQQVGIGTATPSPFHLMSVAGAMYVQETAAASAVEAANFSFEYAAVLGQNGAESYGTGVEGRASAPAGVGVRGSAESTTGQGFGVHGSTASDTTDSAGVFGVASEGVTNGVYGRNTSDASGAAGVFGKVTGTGGAVGVWGWSDYQSGYGLRSTGNMHVAGDIHLDGKVKRAGTQSIAFPPERWVRRIPSCPDVAMDPFGGFATAITGNTCYTAPESDTWLVREAYPGGYKPCTEAGVDGCGANTAKPEMAGNLVRMPLILPNGVTVTAVKIGIATGDAYLVVGDDDVKWGDAVTLYARSIGTASKWSGWPDKKNALVWMLPSEFPGMPDAGTIPYTVMTMSVPDLVVDSTQYTYFVDIKLQGGIFPTTMRLFEVVVEYVD